MSCYLLLERSCIKAVRFIYLQRATVTKSAFIIFTFLRFLGTRAQLRFYGRSGDDKMFWCSSSIRETPRLCFSPPPWDFQTAAKASSFRRSISRLSVHLAVRMIAYLCVLLVIELLTALKSLIPTVKHHSLAFSPVANQSPLVICSILIPNKYPFIGASPLMTYANINIYIYIYYFFIVPSCMT